MQENSRAEQGTRTVCVLLSLLGDTGQTDSTYSTLVCMENQGTAVLRQ